MSLPKDGGLKTPKKPVKAAQKPVLVAGAAKKPGKPASK